MAIGQTQYVSPGWAVDDDITLLTAGDLFETTLSLSCTAGDASITVASTTGAPTSGGLLVIGSEIVGYTAKTATTFTGLTRGIDSTAASHNAGDKVTLKNASRYHEVVKDALQQIQTRLNSVVAGGLGSTDPVFTGDTVRMENVNDLLSVFPYSLIVDQATTNLVPNPSAEVNTTGWSLINGATSLVRTADAWVGGYCFEFTVGSSAQAYGIQSDYITGLSAGTYYTFQARLKIPGGAGTKRVRVCIDFFNALNNPISGGSFQSYEARRPIDDWDRHFVTGQAPTGTAKAKVSIQMYPNALDVGPYNIRVDGCQLEAKPYPSSYADGSMGPGYAWSGTAHQSSSTRTAGLKYFKPTVDKANNKPAFPFVLSANGMLEGDVAFGRYHPNWDPLQSHNDNSMQGPRGFWWDSQHMKLHARSLLLFEMGDPVDLALHRYSDGIENSFDGNPGNAGNPANGLLDGTPLGTLYWRGWQGSGNGGFNYRSGAIYCRVKGGNLGSTVYGAIYIQTSRAENGATDSLGIREWKGLQLFNVPTGPADNPSASAYLYADAGALKARGSGGTNATLCAADPHCPTCGKDFVYEVSNPEKYGYLTVCLWCLTSTVEALAKTLPGGPNGPPSPPVPAMGPVPNAGIMRRDPPRAA